jgi:hypothetical protein
MKLGRMRRVIGGLRYDTKAATVIASDCYWDGSNFERHGRNTWLLRTPNGRYFTVTRTMWQGERDSLCPVCRDVAREMYETDLPEHEAPYAEAFPGVEVQEA